MNESPSILLVEDNEDDIILVLRALRKAGVTAPVQVVRDGEEAMRHLDAIGPRPLPTVVLLDLKLPRRSGHEVLAWIRAHPRLAMLPVVVLTTSTEQIDVQRAYALGANSYLRKPASPQETTELLRAIGLYWLTLNVNPPRIQEAS
ncbi:response regulator [Oxalobacteraceae bacterium OM1]|nr:response regulator [Oxalobacteraceae bacterium OM1]